MAVDYSKLFNTYTPSYTHNELSYINDPIYGEIKVPDGFKLIQDQEGRNMLWADDLVIKPETTEKPMKEEIDWRNAPEEDNRKPTQSQQIKSVQGPENFNKLLDEVSNERGFEDLKNPEMRDLITLQAKRESGFKQKVKSSSSTASGYFQFIDSTRKQYSNYDRESFLNDPKEQVRAAVKYLRDIFNTKEANGLLESGYNKAQVAALGWWYPKSMRMVLNGKKNFSLGGYSIEKALKDYE